MGTAKYIGRVGGLAVALGVGWAVASTPGVAWADPTDSGSSNTDSSPTSSAGTNTSAGNTTPSAGTNTSAGTKTPSAGTNTSAGTKTPSAGTNTSAGTKTPSAGTNTSAGTQLSPGLNSSATGPGESDATPSTGSTPSASTSTTSSRLTSTTGSTSLGSMATDDPRSGVVVATGGAQSSALAVGLDVTGFAPSTTAVQIGGPTGPATAEGPGASPVAGVPEGSAPVGGSTGPTAAGVPAGGSAAAPSGAVSGQPAAAMRWSAQQVVGGSSQAAAPVATPTPALQQPVQWGVVGTTAPAQAGSVQAQSVPSLSSGPTAPSSTVSAAGSPLSGWGALTGGLPGGTGESPVLLAMLGYARKESERTAAGDPPTSPTATTPTSGTSTSQSVAAQTSGASVNNAPTATPQTQQSGRSRPVGDTTAPTVSVTAPVNGAPVSGTVTLGANASDNKGVTGVQFLVDNIPLGAEDTSSPYSVSWNTTTATNSDHILTARARDAAGNTTTSAPVTVTVDNAAPTVSVTAPANGAPVSGTVTLGANASDNKGVTGVQFLVDNIPLGAEDTSSPYSVSWNTTTATNSDHILTARARDAAGNTTTSAPVTVTVDNAAPTVSVTAPANGAPVSGTVTLGANASDNKGVTGVQFLVDNIPLGAEDTSSPYSVSWNTTTATNSDHILTARARDAAGNTTTSAPVTVTVDNAAPTTTPITVGADPTAVVISGNRAYVANQGDNTVSVIDTTTKQAAATIPVGTGPNSLVATRDGTRVYVANSAYNGDNTVSVIDTTTNNVVATIPIPNQNQSTYGYDLAVSPDGTRVYVAYQYDSRVSVIDTNPTSPTYDTVVSTTNVGYYGYGDITVTPDGTRIYRASDPYGDVVVIDTATMTPVGSVTGPGQDGFYPQALAISADGKRAYAPAGYVTEGGLAYSEVSVIDTDPTSATYNTQIATISLPTDSSGLFYSDYGGVFDVAFSPDGKRAYVTSFDGKTTTAIDTVSDTVIGSFTIDEGPADSNLHRSLAVAADGTLYIVDADGTMYVVTVGDSSTAQQM